MNTHVRSSISYVTGANSTYIVLVADVTVISTMVCSSFLNLCHFSIDISKPFIVTCTIFINHFTAYKTAKAARENSAVPDQTPPVKAAFDQGLHYFLWHLMNSGCFTISLIYEHIFFHCYTTILNKKVVPGAILYPGSEGLKTEY